MGEPKGSPRKLQKKVLKENEKTNESPVAPRNETKTGQKQRQKLQRQGQEIFSSRLVSATHQVSKFRFDCYSTGRTFGGVELSIYNIELISS